MVEVNGTVVLCYDLFLHGWLKISRKSGKVSPLGDEGGQLCGGYGLSHEEEE